MQFFVFGPNEKSVFELMTNLKFSFSGSGPGSVHIPPKPIFLFQFSNVKALFVLEIFKFL